MVIDIHSHVLPDIDDGSRSLAVSIDMLRVSKKQGIGLMAATPHFYAWEVSLNSFLEKRSQAYLCVMEQVHKDQLSEEIPEMILGAETAFFDGIGSSSALEYLTFQNTNLLLLEMPFKPWTKQNMDELEKIRRRGFRLLFAHIERYFGIPGNKKYIRELMSGPDLFQVNAECFDSFFMRLKILPLVQKGNITFLGSDCHGMHRRPPNLSEGRKVLKDKLGEAFLKSFDKIQEDLLLKNSDNYSTF